MSPGPPVRTVGRAWCGVVALLLAAALAPAVVAAATPEQIRACVERNGTRYTEPGRAVDAQYADAADACEAALDGGVTVTFEPGGGDSGETGPGGAPTSDPTVGPGGSGDGETPGNDVPAPGGDPGAGSPTPSAGEPGDGGATPAGAPGSAPLVEAAGTMDGAGGPLPSSLSSAPGWLLALLVGVATAVGVAAILPRVRGRSN